MGYHPNSKAARDELERTGAMSRCRKAAFKELIRLYEALPDDTAEQLGVCPDQIRPGTGMSQNSSSKMFSDLKAAKRITLVRNAANVNTTHKVGWYKPNYDISQWLPFGNKATTDVTQYYGIDNTGKLHGGFLTMKKREEALKEVTVTFRFNVGKKGLASEDDGLFGAAVSA